MAERSRQRKFSRNSHYSSYNSEERVVFAVDYKDISNLKSHLTETGKIIPSRVTGMNAKNQRRLTKAIKQARFLSLLPYCDTHH